MLCYMLKIDTFPTELVDEVFKYLSPKTSSKLIITNREYSNNKLLNKKYKNNIKSTYSVTIKKWRYCMLKNIAIRLVQEAVQEALINLGL